MKTIVPQIEEATFPITILLLWLRDSRSFASLFPVPVHSDHWTATYGPSNARHVFVQMGDRWQADTGTRYKTIMGAMIKYGYE